MCARIKRAVPACAALTLAPPAQKRGGRHGHRVCSLRTLGCSSTHRRRLRARFDDHFLADRKSTRLNSSHLGISYAVFCLKKKNINLTYSALHDIITSLPPSCHLPCKIQSD